MTGETFGAFLALLLSLGLVFGGYELHKRLEAKRIAGLEEEKKLAQAAQKSTHEQEQTNVTR